MRVLRHPIASFVVAFQMISIIQIVQCNDFALRRGGRDINVVETTLMFHTNVTNTESLHTQQSQQNERDLTLFGGSNVCPPPGFDAKQDFDIDLYFGRWYAQKQIPVAYQTIDEFFCVTADYTRDKNFCIFCNYAPRIDILNQARKSSVDGEKLGGAQRFFRGVIRRPNSEPAKITVGFFAPFLVRARYWVVAAGSYTDILSYAGLLVNQTFTPTTDYEWAIITGGPPSREGANGTCKPNPGLLNFLGMWMFTRDSIPAEGVITAIESYALNELNLDTSAWFLVQHEGCVYD